MDAPLCRLCHVRHWGACPNSATAAALKPVDEFDKAFGQPDSKIGAGYTLTNKKPAKRPTPVAGEAPGPSTLAAKGKTSASASGRGRPAPKSRAGTKKRPKSKAKPAAPKKAAPITRSKLPPGRPLNSDLHLSNEKRQPWKKLKISRRTYYRRQADLKK